MIRQPILMSFNHNNTTSFLQPAKQSSFKETFRNSIDSIDSTVDDNFSPRCRDSHSSFTFSNDALDSSDARSTSSNENQENSYTVLNCALNQKKKSAVDESKFKTELCKNYSETGQCPYGKKCKFAHGRNELNIKRIHNNGRYKSKKCESFHKNTLCSYGVRCLFAHEQRTMGEILVSGYYERFVTCPDLLQAPITNKKRRLPVFQNMDSQRQESNHHHHHHSQQISFIEDDQEELDFFNGCF